MKSGGSGPPHSPLGYSTDQYVVESKEKLLKAVKDEGMSKEDVAEKRRNQYKEKPLHGQYVRSTEEIRDHKSWNWLKEEH